ncbi:chromatin structure-remodeling complex subunit Rsc2p [[Candida] jaroonii]|uniref:Chromatin structure-remodeling complex subunit Rsc2p n=1 Tax=[Candida] jaroonii TaxID=467808 RepID=A0ACA9YAQ9_9ASCO|nr:chromatin structure-remodeling complex subunit Rsc2p [[Candida] jaroonii]
MAPTKKLINRLNAIVESCEQLKDDSDQPIYETFRKLPPRSGNANHYYKIIKHPVSFHGIRSKIKTSYSTPQQFVDDLAQMSWNARFFNQKGSIYYNHGVVLDKFLTSVVIPRFKSDKAIEGDVKYPNLPPIEDDTNLSNVLLSGGLNSNSGIQTPNDNDEDYNEDEDYDDFTTTTPQPNYYNRLPPTGLKGPGTAETGIKRGRPPIVDRIFETRIKLILKNFKKLRHPQDPERPLTIAFDRLPEKSDMRFYNTFPDPMSLGEIRTKLRSRKYKNTDEFLNDLNEFFTNYLNYYQQMPNSAIYQDLLLFKDEADSIVENEMNKTDKEIAELTSAGGDGVIRLPLDEVNVGVHNYKVGDWVLINNPNNPEKPTVGQIFRLWVTDNKEFINVCWYYRPEQTSHREDRLFYMNEVCKTGQYRDHLANEIIGPCFVLFLTRYQKGDLPRDFLPENCPWFICEFRYNETNHVFNRIRTWRACLPDEVRDNEDPPVIPLVEPRKLIKFESPIKHLLPPNANYNMEIPPVTEELTSPPNVGSVYSRPPDVDDDLGQYYTSPNITRSKENDDTLHGRKAFIFTPVSQSKSFGYPPVINNNSSLTNFQNESSPQPSYYLPPSQPSYSPYKYNKPERKQPTPTPNANLHTSTSNYSMLLQGGIISYAKEDDNQLQLLSDGIIKRQKLDGSNEIIWFRGPPLSVPQKIVSTKEFPVGNSAKYLAWKSKRQQ